MGTGTRDTRDEREALGQGSATDRTLMQPRRPGEEGAGKPDGGEIVPPPVAQMTGVSSAQEAVAYVPGGSPGLIRPS